jgi:hypothetical protein
MGERDSSGPDSALDRLGVRPLIVASHPRSGTHLVIDSFRRQLVECRSWKWPFEPLDRLYLNLDSLLALPEPRIAEGSALRLLRRARRPLIKTHCLPGFANWFRTQQVAEVAPHWRTWLERNAEVCYVLRDGRAVMCSYHAFTRGFEAQADVPLGEFIRQERDGVSRVRAWAEHVRAWLAEPGVHVVRFEELVRQPEATLEKAAERFAATFRRAQPLLPRKGSGSLRPRLARLLGVHPESSAIRGSLEPARAPRWRELFSQEDREFFRREAGELLIELGYESCADWVADSGS